MEIKPMGNTEQEKMSSLWGYFIACCKILDDVTNRVSRTLCIGLLPQSH